MKAKFIYEVLNSEDEWANQEIAKNVEGYEEEPEPEKPKRVKTFKNVMSIDPEKGTVTKNKESTLEDSIDQAEEIIELEDYILDNGSEEQIAEWIWNIKKIVGDEWDYHDQKTGELKNVGDAGPYWSKIKRYDPDDPENKKILSDKLEFVNRPMYYKEEHYYYGIYGEGKLEKILALARILSKEIRKK